MDAGRAASRFAKCSCATRISAASFTPERLRFRGGTSATARAFANISKPISQPPQHALKPQMSKGISNHPLLGTISDKSIAEKNGASKSGVARARYRLGISAFDAKKSGKYIWTVAAESLLGNKSDAEIGRELRISTQAVQQARTRRKIAPFSAVRSITGD